MAVTFVMLSSGSANCVRFKGSDLKGHSQLPQGSSPSIGFGAAARTFVLLQIACRRKCHSRQCFAILFQGMIPGAVKAFSLKAAGGSAS